jgi:methionyl-tRNA formyltransferase
VSRTVFLGTSEFAAAVLRRLASSPHRPALVITPPDRPRGRGRRVSPAPAAEAADELGLELHKTAKVNAPDSLERIREAGPEVATTAAFGQLIREPLLSELEMLNVHPSLLPRWRGAAPIERAIMAGDPVTGVSVMRVAAGLDSGPVALQEETPIGEREDYGSLALRLAEIGGRLLVRALDARANGSLELREQAEEGATYAEKIERAERRLDPARPAEELARVVRALTPHIGAHLELEGGEHLGVRQATALEGRAAAGEIAACDHMLVLGCGEGLLRLEVVQPAGRRPMPADAYLRGHRPPARAAVG